MNSDKLNALIKNRAKESNDLSLHLHQMFFFEHVLMRLEKSKYKDNIILKGGVLLSSIIGSDMRTTKDIDATLKSIPLNEESIRNIFEDKTIDIMAYTIETIIAEKLESIISKNITTTRAKDFYDMYVIVNNHIDKVDKNILIKAIKRTFKHRNTNFNIEYLNDMFVIIKNSIVLKELFDNYSTKFTYAKNVRFEDTIDAIKQIIDILESEFVGV